MSINDLFIDIKEKIKDGTITQNCEDPFLKIIEKIVNISKTILRYDDDSYLIKLIKNQFQNLRLGGGKTKKNRRKQKKMKLVKTTEENET
jgi:hypothetical protein